MNMGAKDEDAPNVVGKGFDELEVELISLQTNRETNINGLCCTKTSSLSRKNEKVIVKVSDHKPKTREKLEKDYQGESIFSFHYIHSE